MLEFVGAHRTFKASSLSSPSQVLLFLSFYPWQFSRWDQTVLCQWLPHVCIVAFSEKIFLSFLYQNGEILCIAGDIYWQCNSKSTCFENMFFFQKGHPNQKGGDSPWIRPWLAGRPSSMSLLRRRRIFLVHFTFAIRFCLRRRWVCGCHDVADLPIFALSREQCPFHLVHAPCLCETAREWWE